MFKYLEKLRKKPEGERRKTVLLISLGITLTIALVWVISVSFRIGGTDFSFKNKDSDKVSDDKIPSLSETFSNFMDQVGDIMQNSTTYESAESAEITVQ